MQHVQNYVRKEGEACATRFVQEHRMLTVRDRNSDLLDLLRYCAYRSVNAKLKVMYKNQQRIEI